MKVKLSLLLVFMLCLVACSNNNPSLFTSDEQQSLLESVGQFSDTITELESTVSQQLEAIESDVNSQLDEFTAISSEIANELSDIDGYVTTSSTNEVVTSPDDYDYVLSFPSNDYPETALHIFGAIEQGYTDVCTIDRSGADDNRTESMKGIPTMDGYDRDEWPMAMCAEGGKGASVAYISASDNRGAGSWVGHQLSQYEDGERILFLVEKPTQLFPSTENNSSADETEKVDTIIYQSCKEVHEAKAAPIYEGDPGYSTKLDRDGDGVACDV